MRTLAAVSTMLVLLAASPLAAQDDAAEPSPGAGANANANPNPSASPSPSPSANPNPNANPSANPNANPNANANPNPDANPNPSSNANTDPNANADPDAAAGSDGATSAGADVEPTSAGPRWTDERVIAWTLFATSLAVAIAGGIVLAAGVDDLNSIENAPDGTDWETVAGARDRAPILTGTGAVVLGLGAVGAAVGAGLLAHFGAEGTWLSVSALPGGLQLRGTF